MNRPIVILAALVFFISASSSEAGQKLLVTAKGGLRMRSGPGTSCKKLGVIPRGSVVEELEFKKESVTLAGKKGNWTRVRWKGKTGWVFGGFLEPAEDLSDPFNAGGDSWFPPGFPENWTLLTKQGGEYVFMQWCFAGIPTITLRSSDRKISIFHGQDADLFTIDSVKKIPGGFRLKIKLSGKIKEWIFKWKEKGRTGYWNSRLYVSDSYKSNYRTVKEQDGNCGEP